MIFALLSFMAYSMKREHLQWHRSPNCFSGNTYSLNCAHLSLASSGNTRKMSIDPQLIRKVAKAKERDYRYKDFNLFESDSSILKY